MNARERVMRAINHEEPDRVPMFMDCSTQDVLWNLIRHVGCNKEEEMLEKLHIDCRWCTCTQDFEPINSCSDGTYVDLWGVRKTNYGGMPVSHPLEHAETIADLEQYDHWPSPASIDYSTLIRKMEHSEGYGVFGGMWGPFLEQCTMMVGMEKFMVLMFEEPDLVDWLLDKTTDFYLECNRRIFELAGVKMQIFFMGDDYGTQTSLLYGPATWRRFIRPRLKKIYDLAKSYGYKVMQHSCGSIVEILPDMIELGLDGIHPIQVSATGMDPKALKKQFSDKVFFAGSVDAMRTLITGTKEEIEQQVRERLQVLGRGGGFIFGPSQGFLPEIPAGNIAFMYEMGYRHGFYDKTQASME